MLLVDDDHSVLTSLSLLLTHSGFEVVTASTVAEALKLIASETFDVLLSDLRMPGAGDGLTVVSAMRHVNPKAVTMIFSSYPDLNEAAASLLLQADEVLVKPMALEMLVGNIQERIKRGAAAPHARVHENVADVLERDEHLTIQDWLLRVELEPNMLPLSYEDRCAHLPQLFKDLIHRLRVPLPLGAHARESTAAARYVSCEDDRATPLRCWLRSPACSR